MFSARAIMFELRTKDGKRQAFPYTYLTEATYEPEKGILVCVSETSILIKGRGLLEIYRHILSNRVTYIQEDFSGKDTEENDLFVEAIEIKTGVSNQD